MAPPRHHASGTDSPVVGGRGVSGLVGEEEQFSCGEACRRHRAVERGRRIVIPIGALHSRSLALQHIETAGIDDGVRCGIAAGPVVQSEGEAVAAVAHAALLGCIARAVIQVGSGALPPQSEVGAVLLKYAAGEARHELRAKARSRDPVRLGSLPGGDGDVAKLHQVERGSAPLAQGTGLRPQEKIEAVEVAP